MSSISFSSLSLSLSPFPSKHAFVALSDHKQAQSVLICLYFQYNGENGMFERGNLYTCFNIQTLPSKSDEK